MRVKTNITQAHLDEIMKYATKVAASFRIPADILQAHVPSMAAKAAKSLSKGSWVVPDLTEFKRLSMHLVKVEAENVIRRETLAVTLPTMEGLSRRGTPEEQRSRLEETRQEAADISLRSVSVNEEGNDLGEASDPFAAPEAAIEASRIFARAGLSEVEERLFRLVAADQYTIPKAAEEMGLSRSEAYRTMDRVKGVLATVTKGMVR